MLSWSRQPEFLFDHAALWAMQKDTVILSYFDGVGVLRKSTVWFSLWNSFEDNFKFGKNKLQQQKNKNY